MHHIAEKVSPRTGSTRAQGRQDSSRVAVWLRQLIETQQDTKDPREFMDTVRVDLFPDECASSPKGDVGAPGRATPRLRLRGPHQVGEHCVGAKVNASSSAAFTLRQGASSRS
jgi:GTP pyrophosphokinase